MKASKYTIFKCSDYLNDDYFIASHMKPSSQSLEYWSLLIREDLISLDEYQKAKEILLNFNTSQSIDVDQEQIDFLWKRINQTNIRIQNRRQIRRIGYSVAASILLLLIPLSFLFDKSNPVDTFNQVALVDTDVIDRSRYEEEISVITPGEREVFLSKESRLDFSRNRGDATSKSKFTHIIVPYGQTTQLTLSDKTKLYIKAGTHVVFPSQFEGNVREIYVDGEVYAEVAKDLSKPFRIINESLEMSVLGTKVGFRAFNKEEYKSVVLLSGKVAVNRPHEKPLELKPNERFLITKDQVVLDEVNAKSFISWINGVFSYEEVALSTILDDLSDFYDVVIDYNLSEIHKITCSGNLKTQNGVEEILDGLGISLNLDIRKINKNDKHYKVLLIKQPM